MEKRELKIIFNKSGSGSTSTKVSVPSAWIKKMGLDIANREVEALFDEENNTIQIKPKK